MPTHLAGCAFFLYQKLSFFILPNVPAFESIDVVIMLIATKEICKRFI
jgi:hypothetical protein